MSQPTRLLNLPAAVRLSTAMMFLTPRALSALMRLEPTRPSAPVTTMYIAFPSLLDAGHRADSAHHSAPDGEIFDARPAHELRVVQVAAIEDHRVLQGFLDLVKIGTAEFLPFGHDDQRVGLVERPHRALRVFQTRLVAEDALRFVHGERIVGGHWS